MASAFSQVLLLIAITAVLAPWTVSSTSIMEKSPSTESLLSGPISTAIRRPCNMFARKSCRCQMKFKPLCGSDGVTYANLCQFQCAQRCEPNLSFAKCGTCWNKQSASTSRGCLLSP